MNTLEIHMGRLMGAVAMAMLLPLGQWACANPEFIPLQEMAQGHSLTGSSQLNDSLFTNPAASAFTNVYSVDGVFRLPKSFSVSILDTRTSEIGGTLGYFKNAIDGHADPLQGVKLVLSGRLSNYFAVGVGGKMLWGPDVFLPDEKARLNDLDTGVLFNYSFLQMGLSARNLAGGNPSLDLDREVSLGMRAGYQSTLFFSAAAASKWQRVTPYQYGFGAEYVSPYYFSLKGGYRFQPKTEVTLKFISAGVSFISPKISFHYAVEFPQQVNSPTEHALGTTLLF